MRKSIQYMARLLMCAVLFVAGIECVCAQKTVYVYKNEGASFCERYDGVNAMSCSKKDADSVEHDSHVVQIIETNDASYRIPLSSIDSVCFHEPVVHTSFARKHLLEEFVSQYCGYCPSGMDGVRDFTANDPTWVVVGHHYGVLTDPYGVVGSGAIEELMQVTGTPSATIDRASSSRGVTFHPANLPYMDKSQFETETYASVIIDNRYNPDTRELKVIVSGEVLDEKAPALKLTVLVKESGIIDWQRDYLATFEGWEEYRHTNVVRAFLTNSKGDNITVTEKRYRAVYTVRIENEWVADNCMVVAFLTEGVQPVIQVAELPVVPETAGGADFESGGIKEVPVSESYPEPNSTDGPATYSHNEYETLSYTEAVYEQYSSFNYWTLMAYNENAVVQVNHEPCIPFAYLYLFTAKNETSIPEGVYTLNTSMEPGTAFAGFRDDETHQIDGSKFYFVNKYYFDQYYLVPNAEWLIAEGTLTIGPNGWSVSGKARNGAAINLRGGTITNLGKASSPSRFKTRNR